MSDKSKALEIVSVEETLILWMMVHGNLCLALRHPDNCGPIRQYILPFVDKLGVLLVERGLLTQAEVDYATQVEREVTTVHPRGH